MRYFINTNRNIEISKESDRFSLHDTTRVLFNYRNHFLRKIEKNTEINIIRIELEKQRNAGNKLLLAFMNVVIEKGGGNLLHVLLPY